MLNMKIFYGWWVLLGLFLIYTANNGILIYTLPLFYPELIDEFGWNAEQVTRPAALFLVVAALIVPFAGILFDRYSTRAIMMIGILALVVGLGFYPAITSLGQLTAIYMLFALGIAACGLVPNMLILTRWVQALPGSGCRIAADWIHCRRRCFSAAGPGRPWLPRVGARRS